MPFVHRVRNPHTRARVMTWLARLGFRRHYHREQAKRGWRSYEEFGRLFSRVLETDTNYVPARQLVRQAREAGLAASFRFTKDLYLAKALSFLGHRPVRYKTLGSLEGVAFRLLRHMSSVTLILEKLPES